MSGSPPLWPGHSKLTFSSEASNLRGMALGSWLPFPGLGTDQPDVPLICRPRAEGRSTIHYNPRLHMVGTCCEVLLQEKCTLTLRGLSSSEEEAI
jgi:hypothetical protein